MQTCPKCRAQTLNKVQSAAALPALAHSPLRCARCKGFWIHLDAIAALRESALITTMEAEVSGEEATDKRTGLCPDGHGILSRVKASWRRPFYVERCLHCDGIWLDAGEWKRLNAEHLLDHLDELWAPAWRARLKREQSEETLHELLHSRLGSELLARVDALAHELAHHAHGDLAMAHLSELFRAKRPRERKR